VKAVKEQTQKNVSNDWGKREGKGVSKGRERNDQPLVDGGTPKSRSDGLKVREVEGSVAETLPLVGRQYLEGRGGVRKGYSPCQRCKQGRARSIKNKERSGRGKKGRTKGVQLGNRREQVAKKGPS